MTTDSYCPPSPEGTTIEQITDARLYQIKMECATSAGYPRVGLHLTEEESQALGISDSSELTEPLADAVLEHRAKKTAAWREFEREAEEARVAVESARRDGHTVFLAPSHRHFFALRFPTPEEFDDHEIELSEIEENRPLAKKESLILVRKTKHRFVKKCLVYPEGLPRDPLNAPNLLYGWLINAVNGALEVQRVKIVG